MSEHTRSGYVIVDPESAPPSLTVTRAGVDMAQIRRLVIDVLKPHDFPLVDFTDRLAVPAVL
jgi:hypothetical protein